MLICLLACFFFLLLLVLLIEGNWSNPRYRDNGEDGIGGMDRLCETCGYSFIVCISFLLHHNHNENKIWVCLESLQLLFLLPSIVGVDILLACDLVFCKSIFLSFYHRCCTNVNSVGNSSITFTQSAGEKLSGFHWHILSLSLKISGFCSAFVSTSVR